MKKFTTILISALSLFFVASCDKENSDDDSNFQETSYCTHYGIEDWWSSSSLEAYEIEKKNSKLYVLRKGDLENLLSLYYADQYIMKKNDVTYLYESYDKNEAKRVYQDVGTIEDLNQYPIVLALGADSKTGNCTMDILVPEQIAQKLISQKTSLGVTEVSTSLDTEENTSSESSSEDSETSSEDSESTTNPDNIKIKAIRLFSLPENVLGY